VYCIVSYTEYTMQIKAINGGRMKKGDRK